MLLAHVIGLEWLARELDIGSVLQPMAPAMYTRLLEPAAPAPPPAAARPAAPAVPKSRHAVTPTAPQPAASAPRASPPTPKAEVAAASPTPAPPPAAAEGVSAPEPAPRPANTEPVAGTQVATAASAAATAAAPAPKAAASVAAAPASPDAAAGDALAGWPVDTRLSYRLGGQFRGGDLYGDARVTWQREASTYQVRVDIDIKYFATLVLTSQGDVTPDGLVPRLYEEIRPGRKRRSAQFGEQGVTLDNGKAAPRPPGMQDTASQFVALARAFASGREKLEVGRTVTFWMARPGGLDRWTYDIVEREVLRTPQLGDVEAFRLKPRPLANARGNIYAEMWFAPSLQYLPVRIKVAMGEEAVVDLLVDRIEQK